MLGGPTVKQLWELAGQPHSIRAIARELRLSRNTVRKYLRAPGVPRYSENMQNPRSRRGDPSLRFPVDPYDALGWLVMGFDPVLPPRFPPRFWRGQ